MDYQVYVLAKDGSPLMPTKRFRKVRLMLKRGEAKVVMRKPFTIQLMRESERNVEPFHLGIDAGRKHIGLAVVDDKGGITLTVQIETRNKEVAKNMKDRKLYRNNRRHHRREKKRRRAVANGTAYKGTREVINQGATKPLLVHDCKGKPSRFMNRVRPDGWLTPTVNHCVLTHLNAAKTLARILPIQDVSIEKVSIAFMKLENSETKGRDFQNGRMKGYENAKELVFKLQGGKCIFDDCDEPIAEYHHIDAKTDDGSNRPENMAGLCKKHHHLCQCDKAWDKMLRNIKKGEKKPFADGSIINAASPAIIEGLKELFGDGNVIVVEGHNTKDVRDRFGVDKSHKADAYCAVLAGTDIEPKDIPTDFSGYEVRQYRRHNRVALSHIRERVYKAMDDKGKLVRVAINRGKRENQKTDSLEEYRKTHTEKDVSRLVVEPASKHYRSMQGFAPGTVVRCMGKERIVRATSNRGSSVFFEGEKASVSPKVCRVLSAPRGLVFAGI